MSVQDTPGRPGRQALVNAKDSDTELLKKIDSAAEAANKTEKTIKDAQADRLAKCKTLGLLLIEAKKRHPAVKDFEAFLKRTKSALKLSAAYDYMRLIGGRKTDAEIGKAEKERREGQRVRKQKSRRKQPKPEPKLEVSVTNPPVTETAPPVASGEITPEQSAEDRKAAHAALDSAVNGEPTAGPAIEDAQEKVQKESAHWLAEFTVACHMHLPKITVEADRQKARLLVSELTSVEPRMKAA